MTSNFVFCFVLRGKFNCFVFSSLTTLISMQFCVVVVVCFRKGRVTGTVNFMFVEKLLSRLSAFFAATIMLWYTLLVGCFLPFPKT